MFERKQNIKKPLDWTKLVIVFFESLFRVEFFSKRKNCVLLAMFAQYSINL